MKRTLILLTLVLFFSCNRQKNKEANELDARIARIENGLQHVVQIDGEEVPTFSINDRLKELGIPGVSIAVVSDGKLEWAKGYGMADISENRPVDTSTLFLAGSISKPISAIRAHQLVEKGKLKPDENVNKFLTSWQVPDNEFTATEKVTLRRILNHTAGLTVWGFPGYDKGDTIPSVIDVLDGKGNTDPIRVYKIPGESWMYSGGGYTIMQLMITDVIGKTFPETMKENVLEPLGMHTSTFENPLPKKYADAAATGYRSNGDEVEGKWPIYPEMAAAGLWTTPSQLIQYAVEIQKIHQSKVDGSLKFTTVEEMLTPGMNGHGLGPVISEYTFGHGGADEGFRADLTAWKDLPNAIVIMVNSDNGLIIGEIKLAIAREYNLPGIKPDIKKIIKMTDTQLKSYTGKYELEKVGPFDIFLSDGHLIIDASFMDRKVHILPVSDSVFVDKKDGTEIKFNMKDNTVAGFTVRNYYARKLED